MFGRCFGRSELLRIERITLHRFQDFTTSSGDPLAYGETDVEIVARVTTPARGEHRVGLLVEDKVSRECPIGTITTSVPGTHLVGNAQVQACGSVRHGSSQRLSGPKPGDGIFNR
jgi:hypothetical protein